MTNGLEHLQECEFNTYSLQLGVYKKIIEHTYQENKTTLLLLPEVTLATQFEKILKTQLPDLPIISFHSASSAKTKRMLWQSLQDKKPLLIIESSSSEKK